MSREILHQNLLQAIRPVIENYLTSVMPEVDKADEKALMLAKRFADNYSGRIIQAGIPRAPRQPIEAGLASLETYFNIKY